MKPFQPAARPGGYEGRKDIMTAETKHDANRYGIYNRIAAIEQDLTNIDGIPDVEFDIRDYGELPQVIVIPHYVVDYTRDDYFKVRKLQLAQILTVLAKHDLHNSGDRIEDYGEHWYIVRETGSTWIHPGETA